MQARLAPLLCQCSYAAIALHHPDVLLLRAAHEQALDGWLQQLLDVLGLQPGSDVLEYRDDRRGVVKRVAWADGHLAAFVFASSSATDGPAADSLLQQLQAGEAWQGSRLTVFAPAGQRAVAREKVICQCKQVGENAIRQCLERGDSVEHIKGTLGCGSVCGSCVPEIKRMAASVAQPA
jgi:assimilatory nitrate reductase catalytic subunit